MASQYSTLVTNQFFDTVLNNLEIGGSPSLVIKGSSGAELVVLQFSSPLVSTREGSIIKLNPPPSAMVALDGEAALAQLLNGAGQEVVLLDVGSLTTNPNASLLISSTSLFAGGMITLTEVKLTL